MTATQETKQELEATLSLKYDANGLIAAVIQDVTNDQVLMVGYMNEEAFRRTLATRRVTFWSRSRQKYWVKGETSGNVQNVIDLYVDCDQDCLLVKVEQIGAACHEGYRSCFFRRVNDDAFTQDNGPENGLEAARLDVIDSPLVNPY